MPIVRKLLFVSVASLALAAAAQAPGPAPAPTFDLASIRQNKTDSPRRRNVSLDSGNIYAAIDPRDSRTIAGSYFAAANQPLGLYIVFAYKLSGTQELALRFNYFDELESIAPAWVTGTFSSSGDRYNIEARAPGNSTIDQMRLMMQALLADRFHLVVRHEIRNALAFTFALIRPGATGPNLQPHPASDPCPTAIPLPDQAYTSSTSSAVGNLPPVCGVIAHVPSPTTRTAASAVAAFPSPYWHLRSPLWPVWQPYLVPSSREPDSRTLRLHSSLDRVSRSETGDTAASFREGLKVQLGLELKSTQAPFDILVIDHVERPSEN